MTFQNGDKVMLIEKSTWGGTDLKSGLFKSFGPSRAYIIHEHFYQRPGESPLSYTTRSGPYPLDWVRPYDEVIAGKIKVKLADIEQRNKAIKAEVTSIINSFLGKVEVKP